MELLSKEIEENQDSRIPYEKLFNYCDLNSDYDINELQHFREIYADKFNPNFEFWSSWLNDTMIQVRNSNQTIAYLDGLFNKGLIYFPHMEILSDYLDFYQQCYDSDEVDESTMRKVFEKVLGMIGMDVDCGALFWKRYREFEIDEMDDLIETGANKLEIDSAKKCVISIFRRQLSLPLLGQEVALRDFDQWCSSHCTENDVTLIDPTSLTKAIEKAKEMREARLIFEENVTSEDFTKKMIEENVRVNNWRVYIDFEIKDKQLLRAQRLYERALMNCYDNPDLFQSYIAFVSGTVKNYHVLETAMNRIMRIDVCRRNANNWKYLMLSLEVKGCKDSASDNTAGELPLVELLMDQHLLRLLSVSLDNPMDYIGIYLLRCNYYRRKIIRLMNDLNENTVDSVLASLQDLRSAYDKVEVYLLELYYPSWSDGWLEYVLHRVNCEDHFIVNISSTLTERFPSATELTSESSQLWDKMISKFPKVYAVWYHHICWYKALMKDDIKTIRQLYKKAIGSINHLQTPDTPFATSTYGILYKEWLSFEEQMGEGDGNVDGILTVLDLQSKSEYKYNASVEKKSMSIKAAVGNNNKANEKKVTMEKSASKVSSKGLGGGGTKRGLSDVNMPSSRDQGSQKTSGSANDVVGDGAKKSRHNEDEGLCNGTDADGGDANAKVTSFDASSAVAMDVDEGKVGQSEELVTNKSVYVKNLSFKATEEDLLAYFNKVCGAENSVEEVKIIRSAQGKHRGMAVVKLNTVANCLKVLHAKEKTLHERVLDVQKVENSDNQSFSNDGNSFKQYSSGVCHPTTVFVSRLSKDTTEQDLLAYFNEHAGKVLACKLAVDKHSGLTKRHALVQFQDTGDTDKALKMKSPTLHSVVFQISTSKFPVVSPNEMKYSAAAPPVSFVDNRIVSSGGKANESSKLVASMKPRGLRLGTVNDKRSAVLPKVPLFDEHADSLGGDVIQDNSPIGETSTKSNADFRAFYK